MTVSIARFVRPLALAGLLAAVLALPATAPAQSLDTPEQRAAYAMGLIQAQQLRGMLFNENEVAAFAKALEDAFANQPKLELRDELRNVQQFQSARRQQATETEKQAAREFTKKAATEPGAKVTGSGLVYREVQPGIGEKPAIVDTVKVHYHGTLRDGSVFDSSVERGQPATFALNRVIPCWTEALQLMNVGGKAHITCPPEIAYGDRGAGMMIKPGAALAFDVELIEIQK